MGMGKSNQETEIKLKLTSAAAGRRLLRAASFRVKRRRVFESNVVYDTPDGRLRAAGKLLRVRRAGRETLLTYKGPAPPGRYKSREEVETHLTDGDQFHLILTRLDFQPSFRYEKYRTEYQRPAATGIVTLDETPVGDFLELEGPPEWIDTIAAELGYQQSDYITATYAELFFESRQVPHPGRRLPTARNQPGTGDVPGHIRDTMALRNMVFKS